MIITGAPARGKTTIGRQVAMALGLPYFSKDFFKEALFDSLGWIATGHVDWVVQAWSFCSALPRPSWQRAAQLRSKVTSRVS